MSAVLALGAMAPPALSAPSSSVTIAFTAQVAEVSVFGGTLCVPVAPGDTITGTYTYDLSAPDSNEVATVGHYEYSAPPNGITVNVGGDVTQTDPANVQFMVELVDNLPGGNADTYLLRSTANTAFTCGTQVGEIAWQIDDSTGRALKSTALPKDPPKIKDFQSIFGLTIVNFVPDGDSYLIRAHVTSARKAK
jgi:hypothetical protein